MGARDRDRFEELVAAALDELPDWVLDRLENVEVLVEDVPPPGEPNLLGLYQGVPLTQRYEYSGALPDRITLYRRSIEAHAWAEAGGRPDGEALRRVVTETVVHEFAHFFGISDERLRELGRD